MFAKNLQRITGRLFLSVIFSVCVLLTTVYPQIKKEQIMEKARTIYQKVERIQIDSTRAVPSIVRGILAHNVNLKDDRQARNFLQKSAELFKINNQTDDFRTLKVSTDKLGMTHLKLQQEYKEIPVWGSELVLHSSSSNELREISGRFVPNLDIGVNPAISSERALEIALNDLGPTEYRWLNPEQEK